MRGQDKIKEIRTLEYPGMTVRVHIPDLTEEERERRMAAIARSAEAVLKEVILAERRKKEKEA